MNRLSGAFPVLPTTFDANGVVDEAGFCAVIEFAIAAGVDGLVFPGLASEYDNLSLDERLRLISLLGEAVRGRTAIIVGSSDPDEAVTRELLLAGAKANAAAVMVMTPKSLGHDVDALAAYYNRLGESGVPLMLQNAPTPMGSGLATEAIVKILAAAPAVCYVKEETVPSGQRITALLDAGLGTLRGVFGGAGGRYITDELSRGAVGTMPASELADVHVALMRAHRAGDRQVVRRLYERMLPILMMQAVYRWRLTKEVLKQRGVIASAYVRAPGPELDEVDRRELADMLVMLDDLLLEGFAPQPAAASLARSNDLRVRLADYS
ncbi:dihydrodipicolinate synthase family protein [Peristeroidobacter soli]|uniref:dihydrodipicolinate synthase family protein n=1 Tax=Peristeroidobacter soli TaxID=2497877 RepID=UPI001C37B4AA|nr:dihydrodipicolinate synthase family protein [Peristeroidobacter soli]